MRGIEAPVKVGTALEQRSQTVLIVEQSAAIQVNDLSASRSWLMYDFQPIAKPQIPYSRSPSPRTANAGFRFPTTPLGS